MAKLRPPSLLEARKPSSPTATTSPSPAAKAVIELLLSIGTGAQCAPPSSLRQIEPRCPPTSSVPSASAMPVQKLPL